MNVRRVGCVLLASALAACDGGETPRAITESAPRPLEPVVARAPQASPNAAAPSAPAEVEAASSDVAAELARVRAELESARARIAALEGELGRAQDERLAREREWLAYTQSIAQLDELAKLAQVRFEPQVGATEAAAAATTPEPAGASLGTPANSGAGAEAATGAADSAAKAPDPVATTQRDLEIARSLRALLVAEQITGFDVLECGHLAESSIGPVVFRTLDDLGRPIGALCAENLALEASLSARTLTFVLRDGYERRGAERIPFTAVPSTAAANDAAGAQAPEHTERRLVFAHVDPRPWLDAVPELFRDVDRREPRDDGTFDKLSVVVALNKLLRLDAAVGVWRVVSLGGVDGGVLQDVQLDQLDKDGRLERKLFADRMSIVEQESGVLLLLQDGAQWRGDTKTPFLDGRYRIFLPRANVAEWRDAGVPGLAAKADPANAGGAR